MAERELCIPDLMGDRSKTREVLPHPTARENLHLMNKLKFLGSHSFSLARNLKG